MNFPYNIKFKISQNQKNQKINLIHRVLVIEQIMKQMQQSKLVIDLTGRL